MQMEDLIQDNVLPFEMTGAIIDAIDAKCKADDTERRRVAALKATSPKKTSRRRH